MANKITSMKSLTSHPNRKVNCILSIWSGTCEYVASLTSCHKDGNTWRLLNGITHASGG